MAERKRPRASCFVMMPFGKHAVGADTVDFDKVYDTFIGKAAELAELNPVRVDRLERGGKITQNIVNGLWLAPIAIADLTLHRPNVFFELGLRQALRRSATVLIAARGTEVPFDVKDDPVFYYDFEMTPDGVRVTTTPDLLEKTIRAHIREAEAKTDSIVFQWIPSLSVTQRAGETRKRNPICYEFVHDDDVHRIIGIRPLRSITEVKDIPIWVNSENRHMDMARFVDSSVSAMIRYWGAEREPAPEKIVVDRINNALKEAIRKKYPRAVREKLFFQVAAGEAFVTESGKLRESHKVQRIIHVAAVEAKPGEGRNQTPIGDIGLCVTNALQAAEDIKWKGGERRGDKVLMPLFGTGTAREDPSVVVDQLISAAHAYFREHPSPAIKEVYFVARTDYDIELLKLSISKFERDLRKISTDEE